MEPDGSNRNATMLLELRLGRGATPPMSLSNGCGLALRKPDSPTASERNVSKPEKRLAERERTLARPAASDRVSSGDKRHAVDTD